MALAPSFRSADPAPAHDVRPFDAIFAAAILVLMVVSIASIGGAFAFRNAALDLAINTVASVAAVGAAALAWIRVKQVGDRPALFESSAFLVLLATRLLLVAVAILGVAGPLGFSVDAPQQWPIYAFTLARALMAILLVLAAVETLRPETASRIPGGVLVLLPSVVLMLFIAVLPSVEDRLPTLLPAHRLPETAGDVGTRGMTAPGLLVQTLIASMFLLGAALHRRIYRRGGRTYSGYLAVALVVAAFSQLHWAIVPGLYAPIVTADEFLNAAFAILLLLGIEGQARSDARNLRLANTRLEELRDVEVERAALAMRSELAREVHDGLAQELWFAKLKAGRLLQLADLDDEPRSLAREVGAAVDRALADARAALTVIRTGLDEEPAESAELDSTRGDRHERDDLRTLLRADPDLPALPAHAATSILRIIMEAITNAQKHSDATTITIRAATSGDDFVLSVADDGCGFDPSAVDRLTFGLRGMRERAANLGGRLEIESGAGKGTTVTVRVPVRGAAS
jgi:signal transduction histidine kinase